MHNEKIILPTGDYLRQLIGQSNINQSEIRNIARMRGVFTSIEDKKTIGPLLIKTGISPYEYSELKEAYKTKEDNPKYKTRSIAWSSSSTLNDALPDSIDYDSLLNDQFGVCKLVSPPVFTVENSDPNHISLDFEISRDNLINDWGENTTYHKGRIEFKKADKDMEVSLSLTHTAKETKDLANKIAEEMITHFKSNNHISQNENIKSIKFNDFSNEGRIKFLSDLTQNSKYSVLVFSDTKDIHFSPDNLKNPPSELEWMKDKIDDLKLKGKDLHSTFFVKEKSYHEFIQLFGLTCQYSYKCSGFSGSCKIMFEFSEKNNSEIESELTLNINMLNLEINDIGISKNKAKKEILDSLEKFKMEAYQTYKLKET